MVHRVHCGVICEGVGGSDGGGIGFDPSLKRPMCLAILESCDTTNSLSVDDNIYAPSRVLRNLAKELMTATRVVQSFSDELSTPVCGSAKYKQTKANT